MFCLQDFGKMPYLRTLVQDFIYVLHFHNDTHNELAGFIARYDQRSFLH